MKIIENDPKNEITEVVSFMFDRISHFEGSDGNRLQ